MLERGKKKTGEKAAAGLARPFLEGSFKIPWPPTRLYSLAKHYRRNWPLCRQNWPFFFLLSGTGLVRGPAVNYLIKWRGAAAQHCSLKGQLISKAIFLGFKSPKKQITFFEGFLP